MVANILTLQKHKTSFYKYYIAYKLSLNAQEARRKAAEAIESPTD
jgi:hypothetical protein